MSNKIEERYNKWRIKMSKGNLKAINMRLGSEVRHFRNPDKLGFVIENDYKDGDEVVKVKWDEKEEFVNVNDLCLG